MIIVGIGIEVESGVGFAEGNFVLFAAVTGLGLSFGS